MRLPSCAALAVVVPVLLATAGCGMNPADAPVNASAKDFCGAYGRITRATPQVSKDDLHDYLNELAHFGTPRGIPTAARNGFEYLIDPDRDFTSLDQLTALARRTDGNGQDAKALAEYVVATCKAR